MAKSKRKIQPEAWTDILGYGEMLLTFAESGKQLKEFAGQTITHKRMAKCLIAIAYGADAREVFGQVSKGGRPEKEWIFTGMAFDYWGHRATFKSSEQQAAEHTIKKWSKHASSLKYKTVVRYATERREAAFLDLESTGMDLTELKKAIAPHQHRANPALDAE
jgi:hypothetical protein